ncbi:colanic acid biosynthesis glycosyltransferase WcaL [candidate division KSB1 bacterium]|nr:glycosyltransferase family 4 protein [candidate division KSB1 bacterium]RQW06300.1 MAG: colanic acid biosynthesis glycosyltransferase WcaL [candidate division KSB1 bacterium]
MNNSTLKIGFIHNVFPVLSQTFISKEMLGLQQLGLQLKIYSLFGPAKGQNDTVFPQADRVHYIIPTLRPFRLIAAHFYFLMTAPLRYWTTLLFAAKHRDSARLGKTLVALITKGKVSREQRQDVLLHFILALPLAKKLKKDGITFVNSHFADAAASFALLCAKILNLQYGVTTHAYDIFAPQYNQREKLLRARFILTCTNYNKTALLERFPELAMNAVHVFYHGIETSTFLRTDQSANQHIEILSVGRLVPKKGFDVLLDVCFLLKKRGQTFKCRIVGDGPLLQHLSQHIEEKGLQNMVELVGAVPANATKAYYQRADLFVLPCVVEPDGNRDGIPNVIAEAMAMQLPVVSSAISGIPELVVNGETGFLHAQRDVQRLADSIEILMQDKNLRHQMGRAGRQRVLAMFDSKVCLQNLYDFYIKELSNCG